MKKLSISIVLAVLALTQFMMSTVFAESENFEENFLDALGLIKMEENYNSDAEISRIEFVKTVFKVIKTDTEQFSTEGMQPFFDITENDEFFKIANIAYKMGIIKGGTDGCFRPYATISPNEATTILLRALYGSEMIEKLGGAEALATTLGLYKDLKVDANSGFTYKNAAVLIYNALSADYIEKNFNGSYYFEQDKTLLSELYKIEYMEGTVDGNYKKSIYAEPTKYNFLTVDGDLFKLGYEKYNDLYFGQNVTVYYTEDSSEDLVIVYMEAEKGSVIKYEFEDLVSLDSNGIFYTEPGKGKVKKEDLSETCITIHNNTRINLTKAFDVSGNGYVTCIDNDDDGKIDILDITTYDIYVVQNVNTVYDRIRFENSDTVINLDDYGDVRIVDKAGNNLEPGSIEQYNVAEISISEDKAYITITVITDKKSVTVAGVTNDSDKDFAVILADDGTEYRTVKGFDEELSAGQTYIFALDSRGNICAKISEGDSTYKIGVVMSATVSEDSEEGTVKLMGTDEKVYKIKVPEKVTFLNFNKRVGYAEAINEIKESLIIRFSEKDGVMRAFEIPSNDENYPGLQKIGELPNANNAYTRYWKTAEIIGGIIPINSESIIIRQDDAKSPADESAYAFERMSELVNGLYYPATIGYRVGNSEFYADVILMKTKGELRKDSPIMLISEVYKKYDVKSEETKTVFKGLVNNAETELILSEEALAHYKTAQGAVIELGVGDCIRYSVDKQNRIVTVKLIFDYSDMKMYGNDDGDDLSTAYGVENLHRTGVVDYVRGNYVKIIADGLAVQEDYLCSLTGTGAYQVSVVDGRVVCETISAFDIESLEKDPDLKDKVFVRMHQGVTGVFIVYKAD